MSMDMDDEPPMPPSYSQFAGFNSGMPMSAGNFASMPQMAMPSAAFYGGMMPQMAMPQMAMPSAPFPSMMPIGTTAAPANFEPHVFEFVKPGTTAASAAPSQGVEEPCHCVACGAKIDPAELAEAKQENESVNSEENE